MSSTDYKYFTIKATGKPPQPFTVYGWKPAPPHSVMAGQTLRHYITSFDTLKDARAAYPEARVTNKYTEQKPSFNHLPPDPDPPVGRSDW